MKTYHQVRYTWCSHGSQHTGRTVVEAPTMESAIIKFRRRNPHVTVTMNPVHIPTILKAAAAK